MSDGEQIQAFYGPSSPWAYLGAERLYAIAERQKTPLLLRPIRVIAKTAAFPCAPVRKPGKITTPLSLPDGPAHIGRSAIECIPDGEIHCKKLRFLTQSSLNVP